MFEVMPSKYPNSVATIVISVVDGFTIRLVTSIRRSPATCNLLLGLSVPMPTFPPFHITNL